MNYSRVVQWLRSIGKENRQPVCCPDVALGPFQQVKKKRLGLWPWGWQASVISADKGSNTWKDQNSMYSEMWCCLQHHTLTLSWIYMISVQWSFNLSSFFFLHLHRAISIQRISNDHIKSTNTLKSFARILQQALPKCIISLHALYISRGSVWFGNGFHSVSINIQLLFVKGMYSPLKYIFGKSHSRLVLVQEYSWCHLGQDNKNLSQRSQKLCFHIPCSFIALYKWGWFMSMLQFRASGSSRTTSSNCIRRG